MASTSQINWNNISARWAPQFWRACDPSRDGRTPRCRATYDRANYDNCCTDHYAKDELNYDIKSVMQYSSWGG